MSLKDLFFVKEEDTQKPVGVEPTKIKKEDVFAATTAPTPSVSAPTPGNMPDTLSPSASDEMVSKIWDQIINRNLPGPDYLELRNNASALEGLPLNEVQRLEAAFKVLKKTYPNLTKETILQSIDTYMGVVEEERTAGLEECQKARTQTVGEKESRLKVMKDTNAETLKQIEDLKKRYDETEANINKMEHEILSAGQILDKKESMFNASIDSALAVLKSDRNKISTLNI